MPVYNIANEAPGARGVGSFLIEPKSALEGVELSEDDALLLDGLDGVTVTESKAKQPEKEKAVAKPVADAKE